ESSESEISEDEAEEKEEDTLNGLREYITKGLLPESPLTSLTLKGDDHWNYYKSGCFYVTKILSSGICRPFGISTHSCIYLFKKDVFEQILKSVETYKENDELNIFFSELQEKLDQFYNAQGNPLENREYLIANLADISPNHSTVFWSRGVEGITHDEKYWYLTQSHIDKWVRTGGTAKNPEKKKVCVQKAGFWRIPLEKSPEKALESECLWTEYDPYSSYGLELGDCECYKGYLFIPAYCREDAAGISPHIAIFNTKTLKKEAIVYPVDKAGNRLENVQWVAVNPQNGKLYTSVADFIEKNPVYVYDIDFQVLSGTGSPEKKQILHLSGEIYLDNYNYEKCIFWSPQGACFDSKGHLYFVNHQINPDIHDGGIWMYKIPEKVSLNSPVRLECVGRSNHLKGLYQYFWSAYHQYKGITIREIPHTSGGQEYSGYLYSMGTVLPEEEKDSEKSILYQHEIKWEHYPDFSRVEENLWNGKPFITEQPENITFQKGKPAVFRTDVSCRYGAVYRWEYTKDGGKTWYRSTAAGANTNTLTINMKESNIGIPYRCRITVKSTRLYTENAQIIR
ncbi:MAG: hypothetical protein Q4B85_14010, partial [Lachnospiraceae bacterium]|nr:hypothetical protein [Lachnospiraceae bacterium]